MRWLCIALFLSLASAGHCANDSKTPVVDKSVHYGNNAANPDEPGKEDKSTPNNPVVIKLLPTDDAKALRDQTTESNDKKAKVDGIGIFINALIAIFTFVIACYTFRIFLTAREVMRRQLRAYVNVSDVVMQPLIIGGKISAVIPYKNFGQTPAYDVRSYVIFIWKELSINPALKYAEHDETSARGILAPGERFVMQGYREGVPPNGTSSPLLGFEHKGLIAKSHAIYVYGRIDYVTAFGDACFTEFRLKRTNDGVTPIGTEASMALCENGNRTEYEDQSKRPRWKFW